jgi:hypothetical protein
LSDVSIVFHLELEVGQVVDYGSEVGSILLSISNVVVNVAGSL